MAAVPIYNFAISGHQEIGEQGNRVLASVYRFRRGAWTASKTSVDCARKWTSTSRIRGGFCMSLAHSVTANVGFATAAVWKGQADALHGGTALAGSAHYRMRGAAYIEVG